MSHQESTDIEQPIVFEVSNEIANKIGGIYTVIASKAPEMPKMLGSGNYFAIGLYNSFKARNDFEELDPPEDFLEVFTKLRADGIDVKFGRWLGGGNVDTILVDPSNLLDFPIITGKDERRIDQIKGLLWDWYKIDSIWMPEVFDPMVAFGWASGRLISELITCSRFSNKKIVAHFHEWISGPGLLYLKKKNVEISTIFMTHATQLGRNIAMGEEDINEVVDEYLAMGETIPPQKAYQYQVEGTHQLEVVCARECDVLITVSEAIAKETECILGRKPDFVIPNGMNFEQITKREDLATIHQSSRKTINQFIETYFNPYYKIDFEKFLLVHISGRYEFHNKGVDVFIKALQEVNEQLKTQQTSSKEILAFIWIPAPISGTKQFITKTFELSKTTSEPYREDGVVNPP
ncbi:MAG: glycogen/starch synthase, partial [Candidatus Heimdallarchaeota archaeon]